MKSGILVHPPRLADKRTIARVGLIAEWHLSRIRAAHDLCHERLLAFA
jgi:hypothetical protein